MESMIEITYIKYLFLMQTDVQRWAKIIVS